MTNISIPRDSVLVSAEYVQQWSEGILEMLRDNPQMAEKDIVEHYNVNTDWELTIQCFAPSGIIQIVVPNEDWVPRYNI